MERENNCRITTNDSAISDCANVPGDIKRVTEDNLNDVIAIPGIRTDDTIVFAGDTIDFIKYCRQNDTSHNYAILSEGDIALNSLHSIDIDLPILVVAKIAMLPILLNLISNYIFAKISSNRNRKHNVSLSIIVGSEKRNKRIDYSGPVEEFSEIVEEINKIKL